MKIILDIPGIPEDEKEHWIGVLRSFIVVIKEILGRKRKATYLVHFFRERLQRGEMRKFLYILSKIISSLTFEDSTNSKKVSITSGVSRELPGKFTERISHFQRVSRPTKVSHQTPKARVTSQKKEEWSKIIEEEIFNAINSR